jgi:hypothetical protein
VQSQLLANLALSRIDDFSAQNTIIFTQGDFE